MFPSDGLDNETMDLKRKIEMLLEMEKMTHPGPTREDDYATTLNQF